MSIRTPFVHSPSWRRLAAQSLAVLALVLAAAAVEQARADASGPTHQQTTSIALEGNRALRTFCVAPDGRVLALVSPKNVFHNPPKDEKKGPGEPQGAGDVLVFDAAGKLLQAWPLKFTPQAVAAAPSGVVFVAGEGQIAKFDKEGKLLLSVQSPHVTEAFKDPAKFRQQAEESLKEQRDAYGQQLKQWQDRQKELSAKTAKKQTATEKRELQDLKSLVESYQGLNDAVAKKTIEQVVQEITAKMVEIRAMSASDKDLFLTTRMVKGYGFAVWRMTHDGSEPKEIITGLSGCCGQMDVQTYGEELFVAENSRHRVARFDRDGKSLGTWGKANRSGAGGEFGGCCNPMNICFSASGDLLTSESDGQVKQFTRDGKFVQPIGTAKVRAGCKNSAIGLSPDGAQAYYYDGEKSCIIVLTKQPVTEPKAETGKTETSAQ